MSAAAVEKNVMTVSAEVEANAALRHVNMRYQRIGNAGVEFDQEHRNAMRRG